jgi:predicted RecA/RadA family phage recombinase
MATNLRAEGCVYDYHATGTVTSGSPLLIGERLAVPLISGVNGDIVPCQVQGVWIITKATGGGKSFAQGQKVYWDDTNKQVDVTDNSGANKQIGWAFEAALTTDTTVSVDLVA